MFLLVLFAIWGTVLAHIFWRAQMLLGLGAWGRLALGLGLFVAGFAYIPARILVATGRGGWLAGALEYLSAWAIGLVSIGWTILLLFEIGAIGTWIATGRRISGASPGARLAMAVALGGATVLLAGVAFVIARSTPRVTTLRMTVPGAAPLRLAVISDSHLGAISSRPQWLRTLVRARDLRPDAVLHLGDIVDDESPRTERQVALLREVFPRTPVYAITGNHEFYSGVEAFLALARRLDIRVLRQEVLPLGPGLQLAGIDDEHFLPAEEAIAQVRPALRGPVLFLAHRPAAARLLADRPETLVLSGHTHAGQIPPMTFCVSWGNGGFRTGWYAVGKAILYVSRGTGPWGPPMRLLASPELLLIEIVPGPRFQVVRA